MTQRTGDAETLFAFALFMATIGCIFVTDRWVAFREKRERLAMENALRQTLDPTREDATLHAAIVRGIKSDPKIVSPDTVESHVVHFLRNKFCAALLRSQDPEQERLVRDLAESCGIMPKVKP